MQAQACCGFCPAGLCDCCEPLQFAHHSVLQEKNSGVTFAKFDTSEDALEKLSEDLKIQTLPSFKFFKGGKEVVEQVVGYKKKPIADAVDKLLKL